MPAKKEPDLSLIPEGFITVETAAHIIGCRTEFLLNRRWVRRHALPALQLRRGWPIYFDEKKLREWCAKQSVQLKPEARPRAPATKRARPRARNRRSGTGQAAAA